MPNAYAEKLVEQPASGCLRGDAYLRGKRTYEGKDCNAIIT